MDSATGGVMVRYSNLPYITLTLMGNIICKKDFLSLLSTRNLWQNMFLYKYGELSFNFKMYFFGPGGLIVFIVV